MIGIIINAIIYVYGVNSYYYLFLRIHNNDIIVVNV
jgi:hypothetical protein